MAFKPPSSSPKKYDTIESMYRDNKTRTIGELFSQQSEVLKAFQSKYINEPNVAIELPTGSGKTLIGLLIAEYKRRNFRNKVLYLCPNNQLVQQVTQKAVFEYGIKAHAFTGSKRAYSQTSVSEYLNADAIAITNYSSLFNVKPFFENPDLIILDDAHVSENYIGNQFALTVDRFSHTSIYNGLLEIVKKYLTYTSYKRLKDDNIDPIYKDWIELIPIPFVYNSLESITNFISENISDQEENRDLYFSWSSIKNHLPSCQFYFGWKNILIRPIIPPTFTNMAFLGATQRLFMSATLGNCGDLERTTCIKNIIKMPLPTGWEKQTIGRRFFLFPEISNSSNSESFIFSSIKKVPRSLIIVPDKSTAEAFKKSVAEKTGYQIFDEKALENQRETFINSKMGVAVLASRYEGIDFEGEQCRLLILYQLPKTINNQEAFFAKRLAANIVLQDRIRSRVIQAIGRCTRGSIDHAAVIVIGNELSHYLANISSRKLLHPEIQAEVEVGIEQSRDSSLDNMLDNIDLFLKQGDDWQSMNEYIVNKRDNINQEEISGATNLYSSVKLEIEYINSLWNGNYLSALEKGEQVFNEISGGSELKGYHAYWAYLCGCAAFLAKEEQNEELGIEKAKFWFNQASKIGAQIPCFHKLKNLYSLEETKNIEWEEGLANDIENLENEFERLGLANSLAFEREIKSVIDDLKKDDYSIFENAQVRLGKLLGFVSGKSKQSGAPDAYWISNDKYCIVFEDKSETKPNTPISLDTIRQAGSHEKWIKTNIENGNLFDIYTIIVTPSKNIDQNASFAKTDSVYYWEISDFRKWAIDSLDIVRVCRVRYSPGYISWKEEAIEAFEKAGMSMTSIINRLKGSDLHKFPSKN